MSNMDVVRLVGYKDFFRDGEPGSRESYAAHIGKDDIQRFCCLMLTYCKKGQTPELLEILQMLFTYKGKTFWESIAFGVVYDEYRRLINNEGEGAHYILCEESLLNLYIWATQNKNIPENIEHHDGSFMTHLFMLYLLFNDDVLSNYDKAYKSAKQYEDKINMRRVFAERFPQNDLVNIDYGKLLFTQLYKLMELLNFLEANKKYRDLYNHFLKDFDCSTKEEFFKALGGAVLNPLNPNKTGINSLMIDESRDSQGSQGFLDKLAFESNDLNLGPTDYKFLRDKPLQKLPNEYRVTFDLFLIKKLYNGIVFKLSGYVNDNPALFTGPLFGAIRDDFSEGVLVYKTMDYVFTHEATGIKIKGNEFKNNGVEREPDYYCRFDNQIMLIESKDFFIIAPDKLSYDFDTIVGGLKKDGRLGKAVLQSATNVGRALLQSLKLDGGYDSQTIDIFPVIIVHDSLYNTVGLNYWVNEWFQQELNLLKGKEEFQAINFSNVSDITLIDIDTLILYRNSFEKGELNLFELIKLYQQQVKFNDVGEEMDEKFGNAILPFSDFVKYYAEDNGINLSVQLISDIYKASGYVDR